MLTSRERLRRSLAGETPDRVGIHESFWAATLNRWRTEGMPADADAGDYFGTELRTLGLNNSFLLPSEEIERTDEYIITRDGWGMTVRNWLDHRSTPELLDFAVTDRARWDELKVRLTSDAGRVDWEKSQQNYDRWRAEGKFIAFSAVPGYEATWRKVGPEALLMAIAADPDWVREMYEYDTALMVRLAEEMFARGFDFDGAFYYDDLGYRNGLLFSPRAYREQLRPCHRRLCDVFRKRGLPVLLHTCGNVIEIIPDLIDAGFTCLQPLEVKAGMDLVALAEQYGDRLAFMGGVDVRTMFEGAEDKLEAEIATKLAAGKRARGYIYHSDHSVTPQVSLAGYQRVLRLVRAYGRYE
jgi:uroporphyrinogen decarboxylase